MTPARAALLAFLAAAVTVHAAMGWWQPIQTDDWEQLLWDVHRDAPWIASHFTFSDALAYAVAHARWLHAAVCGLGHAALVVGAFAVARGRLPRASWSDTLEVIAVSALLWIAQPRPGFTWFARPNVASHLAGAAVAVWLIAALRWRWRVGRAGAVGLVLAGLAAGSSSPQIAVATAVGAAIWLRRTPPAERAPWMRIAFGALIAGMVAELADPPRVELLRVIRRNFDTNLNALFLPIRECGQLLALLALLTIARLVLDALRPPPHDRAGEPLPAPREALAWFWAWLAICAACQFGPRYTEATLLPASVALVAGALPHVRWLCAAQPLRWAIIAIAIGVHAIQWPIGLVRFAGLDREFRDRIARLERAPRGSVAVIAPYSEPLPTPWFFGEDLAAASRQVIGIELYGVRDIAFSPRFGKLDDNPQVAIRLEVDGLTAEQVAAASPPFWSTEVLRTRDQFERFAARAVRAAGTGFTARLVVDDLPFAERRGRPLLVAWYEAGRLVAPEVVRRSPDPTDRQIVTLPAALAAAHPEAYIVRAGAAESTAYEDNGYRVRPMVGGRVAVVACEPRRCLLVDAFIPRF